MAVHHRHHVGPGLVNLAMDEPLQVRALARRRDQLALQVIDQDVLGPHQPRRAVAGQQKVVFGLVVPHADVAKAVHNALLVKDAVGHGQFLNQGGVGSGQGHGKGLSWGSGVIGWGMPGFDCGREDFPSLPTKLTGHASRSRRGRGTCQQLGHEHAVRVWRVVAKRPAVAKTEALVQALGWLKCLHGTGFQAQAGIAAQLGHG